MKKKLFAVGILSCVVWGSDVIACGDKFLVVSRGTRFQRASAARQGANILVYASPNSTLPKALAKAEPDTTLVKAGYQPTLAQGTNDLDLALKQGGWDLIVADLTDSADVRTRSQIRGVSAPMILPVVFNATGTEIAQAKKDFQRVLKGPVRSQAFLQAIDDALAAKPKLSKTS